MSPTEDPLDPSQRAAAPVSDEEAWAEVRAAWDDEARHHAYLDRFESVERLAVAAGRYKAILAERPEDAVALRMKAEIVKRATAWGLAALPKTRLPFRLKLRPGWTILAFAVWIILVAIVTWWRGQP